VGGARQLARKNLGKRHLIYFFECNDAPFTVLGDSRLTKWEDGFLEEYDLGKTAKSGNKSKAVLFDKALSLAQMENERPIEMRMDWNHQTAPTLKIPKAHKTHMNSPSPQPVENAKKKQKIQAAGESVSSSSAVRTGDTNTVNRKSINITTKRSLIESSEDGPLVCKILRRLPMGVGQPPITSGLEFSSNVGFITLPSKSATFEDIRKAAENELDDDCFPQQQAEDGSVKEGESDGPRWKFYVPKLGESSCNTLATRVCSLLQCSLLLCI
jgi:hypothetical protein